MSGNNFIIYLHIFFKLSDIHKIKKLHSFKKKMSGSKICDSVAILRGIKIVFDALLREQQRTFPHMVKHAELKSITDKQFLCLEKLLIDVDSKKVPVSIHAYIFIYFNEKTNFF